MQEEVERPARLSVGVVGAGRVGAVLGAAWQAAGHRVVAASGLSDASVARVRDLLPGVRLFPPEGVVERAELVLLAVPDHALEGLVTGLSARRCWQAGQIVVHVSPRHGVSILAPALQQHVLPVALHPAMRFTGTALDLERLPEACMAVTTADALRPIGEALAIETGAEPVWVAESDRSSYAAALAHAADHLPTLVDQSARLLARAGIPGGRRLLATVMLTSLDEALRSGGGAHVPSALHEPAALLGELERLWEVSPDARALHVALARASAGRALAHGDLCAAEADGLLDTLRDPPLGGRAGR